ncbi:putative pantetheine-phosphate adenylyltransferase [Sporobolomyces koalae]|uniref:putative pantetheine-phosphate adenylyltransferase n=1 Tax=Sporobolomyces koalae TaxID=500713 RepID=UPI00316D987A
MPPTPEYDAHIVLSFPSLPALFASKEHLALISHTCRHADAVLVAIKITDTRPSPWSSPLTVEEAPSASGSSSSVSASDRSNSPPPPTALWLPLERALASIYSAATREFLRSGRVLAKVDVVVDAIRQIATCPPPGARVVKWEYSDPSTPASAPAADTKLESAERIPEGSYPVVALGGTFDHLHAGHKILLSMACSIATRKVIVGVSDDALLGKKQHRAHLESIQQRIRNVEAFIELVRPTITHQVVPLQDVYGPTATDPDIQALVVSEETRAGGDAINKLRAQRSLSTLTTHVINLVSDDGSPTETTTTQESKEAAVKVAASDSYADAFPSITFSLLSPVIEESVPSVTPKLLHQVFSPPSSAPPSFAQSITGPSIVVHREVVIETNEKQGALKDDEPEDFVSIFSKFSFQPKLGIPSKFSHPNKTGTTKTTVDVSPTSKSFAQMPVIAERQEGRHKGANLVSADPDPAELENGWMLENIGKKQVKDQCQRWAENCHKALKDEKQPFVNVQTVESIETQDPHPIYTRRCSVSQPTNASTAPAATSTCFVSPTGRVVVSNTNRTPKSRTSSLASSSRPSSLVLGGGGGTVSCHNSPLSTPQTSPTSSQFNDLNNNKNGSRASSIKSTTSKLSLLKRNVQDKLLNRRRSTSFISPPNPATKTIESQGITFEPTLDQVATAAERDRTRLGSLGESLPSLAQMFPPSAPTPVLFPTKANSNVEGSNDEVAIFGKGLEKPEQQQQKKKKKRRDSMIRHWKDEQKQIELNLKLEEAYSRIERDKIGFRKSFDL